MEETLNKIQTFLAGEISDSGARTPEEIEEHIAKCTREERTGEGLSNKQIALVRALVLSAVLAIPSITAGILKISADKGKNRPAPTAATAASNKIPVSNEAFQRFLEPHK